jgi:hypothetical protein
MINTKRDPSSWQRFTACLDHSYWVLWSLHRQLKQLLPASRSEQPAPVERIGW